MIITISDGRIINIDTLLYTSRESYSNGKVIWRLIYPHNSTTILDEDYKKILKYMPSYNQYAY